jgi:hypothetical protein
MNANAINTTSSPIFIRSTQPDGTHVYIQSNQIQQQMQQTREFPLFTFFILFLVAIKLALKFVLQKNMHRSIFLMVFNFQG